MGLRPTSRDRYAAALFASLALLAIGATIVSESPVMGIVAVVAIAAALFALRGYPIDRDW